MARWKLATAHYLMVADAEWEYVEQDRTTGRPIRKKFAVPRYLDPKDPTDWTSSWGQKDNADGEIIVCRAGKGEPRDIIFHSDPTPDMVPLDDEARAESALHEGRWAYKPDDPNAAGFNQSLIDKFQIELSEQKPVEIPGLSDLVAAMAEQNKMMAQAMTALTRRP